MIHVYAIAGRVCAVPVDPLGLEEAPPFLVRHGDVAALVGEARREYARATEANLWRHESLIERLMGDGPVLPVCFGTTLDNAEAVRAILATHHDAFVANLQQVHGRVELGLRVLWGDEPAVTSMPHAVPANGALRGHVYMAARLAESRANQAQRERASVLVEAIGARLTALAVEHTQKMLPSARQLLTAAYLVEQARVAAFRQAVASLASEHPALQFLCTGPWPPYNFVTIKLDPPAGILKLLEQS